VEWRRYYDSHIRRVHRMAGMDAARVVYAVENYIKGLSRRCFSLGLEQGKACMESALDRPFRSAAHNSREQYPIRHHLPESLRTFGYLPLGGTILECARNYRG